METLLLFLAGLAAGIGVGYAARLLYGRTQLRSAENQAQRVLQEAKSKAESATKERELEVREKIARERQENERDQNRRRQELSTFEKRLEQREDNLDRRAEQLTKREKETTDKESQIVGRQRGLDEEEKKLNQQRQEQQRVLEKLAQMNQDEAKQALIKSVEEDARRDAAVKLRIIEQETRENAQKLAQEILSVAVQRVAPEYASQMSVSTVPLPNDEMKGRIIGRDGRNIKAFEQATGVDLVIDDTPDVITLSCLDGFRREIARITLEKLLSDGRIQPTRIEEEAAKVRKDMEHKVKDIGKQAADSLGVSGVHPEILTLLGKLKFRSSYGQNQLAHTLDVARIAGSIAAEMGADVLFCKRAGLLHDIGKALDKEVEQTHHEISAQIAKQHGEGPKMLNAILAHHEGVEEPKSTEAFILAAADAISAARPGARREDLEQYIKRIQKLEQVVMTFRGVEKAFAIQAGREIRVLVEPESVDDVQAATLAREIARKIEQELQYPGQIRVTVIRETRAQDTAK